jgi:large subunit ribosomal protein L10
MPSQKNIDQLSAIKDQLKDSKAIILSSYSKLSVSDQNELRSKISGTNGSFTVVKNNILKLALKDKLGEVPSELTDVLHGSTAMVIANEDAVTTTKALVEFAKDKELPEIKIGFMDNKVLTVKDIEMLSKLPGRLQLLSSLLAQLQAPASALVRQLQAPAQRLVYALEAIRNK